MNFSSKQLSVNHALKCKILFSASIFYYRNKKYRFKTAVNTILQYYTHILSKNVRSVCSREYFSNARISDRQTRSCGFESREMGKQSTFPHYAFIKETSTAWTPCASTRGLCDQHTLASSNSWLQVRNSRHCLPNSPSARVKFFEDDELEDKPTSMPTMGIRNERTNYFHFQLCIFKIVPARVAEEIWPPLSAKFGTQWNHVYPN